MNTYFIKGAFSYSGAFPVAKREKNVFFTENRTRDLSLASVKRVRFKTEVTHHLNHRTHFVVQQQCGILTSVDSDEPLQPPFKLRNSKWCSVRSVTIIEYSSDQQRL